jgi:hypothetical protein
MASGLNPRICALFWLAPLLCLSISACNSSKPATGKAGLEEAVSIATDAYIYSYPLVTLDMTRKQMTNVAVPDQGHAPMGQLVRMRTYPAADYHAGHSTQR